MEEMTLRDKFACSAATAMAFSDVNSPGMSGKAIIAMAYIIADHMLEARGMTKEQVLEWALEGKENVI